MSSNLVTGGVAGPCAGVCPNRGTRASAVLASAREEVVRKCRRSRVTENSFWSGIGISHTQFVQCFFRTARPLRDGSISGVLQIIDAHSRRPEPGGGQIAKAAEERDTVA